MALVQFFKNRFDIFLSLTKSGVERKRLILRFLARYKRLPIHLYSLVTGVAAIGGSVILMSMVFSIFPALTDVETPFTTSVELAFYWILLGPILETFLLAFIIFLIQKFVSSIYVVSFISACVWGMMHGYSEVGKFFGTIWSFYLFSLSYLWWKKRSLANGLYVACLAHIVLNSIVFSVLWASLP